VSSVRASKWQQATALVSLSTCGAMTGFAFAKGTVTDMTSPASLPVRLLAQDKQARPAPRNDSALRSAIVAAARNYLRLARDKSPAEMAALIWDSDSVNGADHGESCAAFASLTLELGSQATGQQSWVTGGTSYPWPLHAWADVRVDENPSSPGVVSMVQDAQAHGRWHPLGDGYTPQPGDWVLFDGHVEVVTSYTGGVLDTIGGDSMPNFSVNAHSYRGPLAAQGVIGFVNNGELVSTTSQTAVVGPGLPPADIPAAAARMTPQNDTGAGQAEIPGLMSQVLGPSRAESSPALVRQPQQMAARPVTVLSAASIPGLMAIPDDIVSGPAAGPGAGPSTNGPESSSAQVLDAASQQAFINEIAPGAVAAQQRYGIPAAVTIAQAIDESGWGRSELATQDHNLFGIKGTGPAGSVVRSTQEYVNGEWVTTSASFRSYHNVSESIADHTRLLATAPAYQQARADRNMPDAFANALTGVYATDPSYGSNLIALMKLYNLYRYDAQPTATAAAGRAAERGGAADAAGARSGAPRASASQRTAGRPAARRTGAAVAGTRQSGTRQGGRSGGSGLGAARIPGLVDDDPAALGVPTWSVRIPAQRSAGTAARPARATTRTGSRASTKRYAAQMPAAVTTAYINTAKPALARTQPLYEDVAAVSGIAWELLAACDWMECRARPRYSPVRGEKLGARNPDGTRYRTKSEAVAQCARELTDLARAVYQIDLTAPTRLSIRELASVFAAFRWGGLLAAHRVSAMEFPYSVEGLTSHHVKMRWPDIREPNAPDRPGSRFRMAFGAVPVVLSLGYPAVG
jgi:Mannosyl-glycoprotein endo-beta-N-acetylglucosaminidase